MTTFRPLSSFSLKEKEQYIYNTLMYFKMTPLAKEWKKTISPLIAISDNKEFGLTDEKLDFLQSIRIELLRPSKHVTSKKNAMSQFFEQSKMSHIIARIFCEDLRAAAISIQIVNFHMDEGTTILTIWN